MKSFKDRIRTHASTLFLVLVLAAVACRGQSIAPVIEVANPPNAAAQLSKPYVVLVSLDGFRYDYAKRYGAKRLLELAARGASAPNGMIPVFPSLTFPNHYTLVTGLYPEHHGIVANSFYDPARKERYSFSDSKTNGDGSWYGGTPLWALAEQQGMRSASFFWPGSEAEIQGKRPSYYMRYDDKFPDETRVEQILAWLRLPPEKRPHFITLYYSNVDHAGHVFGPDAPETGEAVRHVDGLLGKLADGIATLGLAVDLIVVSDHGMETERGGWIALDQSLYVIAGLHHHVFGTRSAHHPRKSERQSNSSQGHCCSNSCFHKTTVQCCNVRSPIGCRGNRRPIGSGTKLLGNQG